MNMRATNAVKIFEAGSNCSQAVFTAFCEDYGVSKDLGLKISMGLGAGVALNGEICGAVSGAILILGLKFGHSKEETYQMTKIFTEKFKLKNKTLNCTKLVGYDLSNKNELDQASNSGNFTKICSKLVSDSIEILEEIIT